MCTLTTASSCHCQCLMELPVGQHFIISVALSIANPSLTLCVCRCEREEEWYVCVVSVSLCVGHCSPSLSCAATCQHNKKERHPQRVGKLRVAGVEIRDCERVELLLPSCQRSGIHFRSLLAAAPHVHSKPNETLHSFPRLSPPLVS